MLDAALGVVIVLAEAFALLAEAVTWDAVRELGVPVACLALGLGLSYKFTTLPERQRAEAERAERIAAQEREREAYQVTTPALIQANTNNAAILDVLRGRRGS